MSDYDHLPDLCGPLPLDLQVRATPEFKIPTTEFIRPCKRIEPDTKEFDGVPTIADRYGALTTELPLAGADAMKPLADGELLITAHLRARAPWYRTAIDLLDQQWRLQLWLGRPWIAFRPMLLVGPPGCGKSHLARMIADQAGVGHSILSLAGVADSTTVEGTPRGFTSTTPCFPALTMAQHWTANPIAVIEEIDKANASPRHGDPAAAMLTLIEPGTAKQYWDRCLLSPIDISHVNWNFTANTVEGLSAPLRSRLDIVHVEGPAAADFSILLVNLLDEISHGWAISPTSLPDLLPESEDLLRQRFGRHRSVGDLSGNCVRRWRPESPPFLVP